MGVQARCCCAPLLGLWAEFPPIANADGFAPLKTPLGQPD